MSVSASEFPPADREAWRQLVDKVLKGAPYDKRLVARTYDGLSLDALTPRAEARAPLAARPGGLPWTILARADMPEPQAANAQALEDLAGGSSGLALVFAGAATAYGFGLAGAPAESLATALGDVRLDFIETRVEAASGDSAAVAAALVGLVEQQGVDPGSVHVDFGFAPPAEARFSESDAGVMRDLFARRFKGTLVTADARPHHDAGASAGQELAAALAGALEAVRALDALGLAPAEAVRRIGMSLAVDADQFETMAKLRAARLLWSALTRELGVEDASLSLHAQTSWRMTTRRDPHVNMLRASIAAFAAGAGGADRITVLPFTQALGLPDAFARRMARNIQLILMEEAHIHVVADPGAGAGAVEGFTDALAETAWDTFREIERRGGMGAAVAGGWWGGEIVRLRDRRMTDVASRRLAIVGVSEYPSLDEKPVKVLSALPALLPGGEGGPAGPDEGIAEQLSGLQQPQEPLTRRLRRHPLPTGEGCIPARLAEPFEALRAAADAHAARHGAKPAVFLATLGSLSAFAARAGFARNLFAAGGIASLGGAPHAGIAALTAAYTASGARLACLCGSDEDYALHAADAARALIDAGAQVWLAGRLADPEELALAGVSHTIHAGGDVVAALARAQDITMKPEAS